MVIDATNALEVTQRVVALALIVPALVYCATRALLGLVRKGCAANRYCMWLTLSALCAALPIYGFSGAIAHRYVSAQDLAQKANTAYVVLRSAPPVAAQHSREFRLMPPAQIEPSTAQPPRLQVSAVLAFAFAWLFGTALLLARLCIRLHTALQLKRGDRFPADRLFARNARIVCSDAVRSPVAIGYLRPTIVIPPALAADEMRTIREHALAHEEAHLRRCDDVTALLHQVFIALAWFNPVVWFIAPHLEAEREKACDDAVVLQTHAPKAYGRSLLALSGRGMFARPEHVLALFESPQRLTDRIEALVSARPRRLHPQAASACICALALAAQCAIASAFAPGFALAATAQILDLPPLSAPRADHVAALLPSGDVLIAGGLLQNGQFLRSAEIYMPQTRTYEPIPPMHVQRAGAASATLRDGRVLIAGGWTQDGITRSTEIFDPSTRTFQDGPPMLEIRADETATVLPDGRVLLAGGAIGFNRFTNCSEIYDPQSNRFLQGGIMHAGRGEHSATLLRDGTVLLAGGSTTGNLTLRSAEIYNPDTHRFTQAGDLSTPRTKHSATLLSDGRVLIAGGGADYTWQHVQSSAELYDPATRTFRNAGAMNAPRFKDAQATVTLADGSVLFAGGAASLERFDPRTRRFSRLSAQSALARHFGTATVLRDGSVLLAGGYGDDALTSASSQLVVLR